MKLAGRRTVAPPRGARGRRPRQRTPNVQRRRARLVPRLAERLSSIKPSATVALNNLVVEKRKAGADVVSFSVGEPDFDTPAHVKDAAIKALREGRTKYTPGPGIPELRQAIATSAAAQQKIPCEAKNVLVTPAKMGIFLSLQATCGPGDEVLLPDPAWVSYEPMIQWTGAKPIGVRLDATTDFRTTPDAVAARITKRTKAIILNSPSNPTGGVDTPTDVKGIAKLAADHDVWVISDEIYRQLLYEGTHHSPASLPGAFDRTITIDGLSKSFAMTGWRMGWAIAPEPVVKELDKLQSQSLTHCTSFAQYGAVAAVAGPQDSVATMRAEFKARRDLMLGLLRKLPGVECATPHGAFYAFPKFDSKRWGGLDDVKLAERLLSEANVAATPGSSFGPAGTGHLRLSYATSRERIEEGIKRMAKWQAGNSI
jgi:aspartate aminotransferase